MIRYLRAKRTIWSIRTNFHILKNIPLAFYPWNGALSCVIAMKKNCQQYLNESLNFTGTKKSSHSVNIKNEFDNRTININHIAHQDVFCKKLVFHFLQACILTSHSQNRLKLPLKQCMLTFLVIVTHLSIVAVETVTSELSYIFCSNYPSW